MQLTSVHDQPPVSDEDLDPEAKMTQVSNTLDTPKVVSALSSSVVDDGITGAADPSVKPDNLKMPKEVVMDPHTEDQRPNVCILN